MEAPRALARRGLDRSGLVLGGVVLAILVVLGYLTHLLAHFLERGGHLGPLGTIDSRYLLATVGSVLIMLIVVVALRFLGAGSLRAAFSELGLFSSPWRGLAFGFSSATLMFLGFALTRRFSAPAGAWAILGTVTADGLGPLAEEVVFRAFGVGTLRKRCGTPLWAALALPALAFGYWHWGEGGNLSGNLELFVLTALGGLFFGWFYLRWGRDIWVPASLHAAMNLSWDLFAVSDHALGGWFPFALQASAIVIAVLITIKFTGPISSPGAAAVPA